ncbi:ATP-binding protein [Mangrovihabitans endophyticus]|nr:helix-turn-helix domain-containing protein [Mangrovihabitans endophyticus]
MLDYAIRVVELSRRVIADVATVEGLAAVLRQLRRREARREGANPLTYRELAAKTGWSHGIIGEYFAGRVLPPTDRFDVLVRLLGATPAEQGWLATARDVVEEHRRAGGGRALGRLPPAVPGFVARAEPLATLDRLVDPAADGAPVVTVSGMAGVGKTALVLHWAHRAAGRFRDGQLYLNLRGFDPAGAPVAPDEAVRTLLDALGVPLQRLPPTVDAQIALYRNLLVDRCMLLVFDNARDAGQVRPLLPGGGSSRTLVTSRDRLAGLVSLDGAQPVRLDLLTVEESRELLAARLGSARLFAEPRAVDEAVAACSRLPLALAIVAGRAALNPGFPLDALAGELRAARGGLEPFSGTDPSSDVRAVFSWSYRSLSTAAAQMFRLLALHPGPDVGGPAAASLAGVSPAGARPLLRELTDATLTSEHRPDRYACHDLLRAYAAEMAAMVDSDADRHAAVGRLLDHYLHTAHTADLRLDPHRDPIPLPPAGSGITPEPLADHEAALAWLDTEFPVLLAAIPLAVAENFDRQACLLVRTLAHFLERRGHWTRWVAAHQVALVAARRLGDPAEEAPIRRSLGRVNVHLGRSDEAVTHLTASLDLYREVGDSNGQGRIEFDLGWVAARQERYDDVLRHSRTALEHFIVAGNRSGQGRAYNNIGLSLTLQGRHVEAVGYCRRALDLLQAIDDRYGAAGSWDSLGRAQHQLGRYREAADSYVRADGLWRALGNRFQQGESLVGLGDTQAAAGDLDGAARTWQRALDIFHQLDHPDAEAVRGRLVLRLPEQGRPSGGSSRYPTDAPDS